MRNYIKVTTLGRLRISGIEFHINLPTGKKNLRI